MIFQIPDLTLSNKTQLLSEHQEVLERDYVDEGDTTGRQVCHRGNLEEIFLLDCNRFPSCKPCFQKTV